MMLASVFKVVADVGLSGVACFGRTLEDVVFVSWCLR